MQDSMASISVLYSVVMMAAGLTLSQLWAAINVQQIIIQIPLMKYIKFPGNSMIYMSYIIEIATFDLFPTEWIEERLYYLPEKEAFNINFESAGIESTFLVLNIGSAIWISLVFIFLAIVTLPCKKFKFFK